ncbi:nucleoside ABC transporter membrane protein [Anaerolinea thermolimosa]|uniref:Nucleoside ABC transporter membrane protein n=1 Tax=Anaerolinea thermolimosa TaxID=229919 RepID=A0A7U9KP11_9CHLR|nr:ABC transporter permease [Anaerolinea thermolimosa]GAP08488.1 nucleoside ABC transporter membrane protein [Anaerolinea thermolimosa]
MSKPENKPDVGKVFLEEVTRPPVNERVRGWQRVGRVLLVPALAVVTGLLLGAVLIILTSESVWEAFRVSLGSGLVTAWNTIVQAYTALFTGALGDPVRIVQAFQSGDALEIRRALNPIPESLVNATPYIFAGLAVALGFRSGLFNIGVEGQLFMGAAAATYVGYAVKGLPGFIHMPLAFLAGALGGAVWGFIPGWLKAKTGGHEVINTIMMNWIAFRLTEWLLGGPMTRPGSGGLPISPMIEKTAEIPQFFPAPIRFHLGFFIALGMAWLVHWLLFKTTWGFDLRTVGANPNAARYAGMNITRNIILAMTLSGALAGMAGANQILAVNRSMALGLSPGYGFDSIALALLGNSTPVGVILSSLLFGALRNGATRMELLRIPNDIVSIIQALILVFVAAPAIIRTIYRVKVPKEAEEAVFVGSWGGGNK